MMANRTRSDVHVAIERGFLAALVLGLLQACWYYVANRAAMSEAGRAVAKNILFWSGVIWVFAVGLRSAMTSRASWRRDLIVTTAIMLAGASLTATVIELVLGRSLNSNSLLIGQPAAVRGVAGIIALLGYVAAVTTVTLLCGAVARAVLPRRERP